MEIPDEQSRFDEKLLKRWEPVVEYAEGNLAQEIPSERFLPMPVEYFVGASSLWLEYRFFDFFAPERFKTEKDRKLNLDELPTSPEETSSHWQAAEQYSCETRTTNSPTTS